MSYIIGRVRHCRYPGCINFAVQGSKHCKSHADLEYSYQPRPEKPKPFKKGANHSLKRDMTTWIYFVTYDDEYVKIGKANDVFARMKDLQIGSPGDLKLLACVESKPDLEFMLHKALEAYWHKGEWFKRCKALDLFIDMANADDEPNIRALADIPPSF